jgi:hypothetical protein
MKAFFDGTSANKFQVIPSAFSNLPEYTPKQQFLERRTGRGESASRLLDGSGPRVNGSCS